MKAGLSLIKNELIPLWLTATASAADAGIHEKKGSCFWGHSADKFKWRNGISCEYS